MIWIILLGVLSLIAIIFGFLPRQSNSVKTIHPPFILKLTEICLGLCLVYWLIWFATDIRILGFSAFYFVTLIGIISALSYPFMLRFMSIRIRNKILPFSVSMCINLFLLLGLVPFINYFFVYRTLNNALGFERDISYKSEEYVVERGTYIISSGGQFKYMVFQRHSMYEKKIDSFHGYPREIESNRAFLEKLNTKSKRNDRPALNN